MISKESSGILWMVGTLNHVSVVLFPLTFLAFCFCFRAALLVPDLLRVMFMAAWEISSLLGLGWALFGGNSCLRLTLTCRRTVRVIYVNKPWTERSFNSKGDKILVLPIHPSLGQRRMRLAHPGYLVTGWPHNHHLTQPALDQTICKHGGRSLCNDLPTFCCWIKAQKPNYSSTNIVPWRLLLHLTNVQSKN